MARMFLIGKMWSVRYWKWNIQHIHLYLLLQFYEGHKYLFSDETHTWQDSIAECELYGGWLVNIGGVQEQNCLIKFVVSKGWSAMYWTDGETTKNIYLFSLLRADLFSLHRDSWSVGPRIWRLQGHLVQSQVYMWMLIWGRHVPRRGQCNKAGYHFKFTL